MAAIPRAALALALAAVLAGAAAFATTSVQRDTGPRVVLYRAARDSMNAVFIDGNRHWNELADLNTLERMLGTVRPTQREFLGCLQGHVDGSTVVIDGWVPASNMKQLQLAVTGDCDSVPRLVGTWHTHPYHADVHNKPVKERSLSKQDLMTFGESSFPVTLVVWDVDSIDVAARGRGGEIRHPAPLRVTPLE